LPHCGPTLASICWISLGNNETCALAGVAGMRNSIGNSTMHARTSRDIGIRASP
jgi:hypothetical protein